MAEGGSFRLPSGNILSAAEIYDRLSTQGVSEGEIQALLRKPDAEIAHLIGATVVGGQEVADIEEIFEDEIPEDTSSQQVTNSGQVQPGRSRNNMNMFESARNRAGSMASMRSGAGQMSGSRDSIASYVGSGVKWGLAPFTISALASHPMETTFLAGNSILVVPAIIAIYRGIVRSDPGHHATLQHVGGSLKDAFVNKYINTLGLMVMAGSMIANNAMPAAQGGMKEALAPDTVPVTTTNVSVEDATTNFVGWLSTASVYSVQDLLKHHVALKVHLGE